MTALTNSQTKAIESQKQLFSSIYPDAEFVVRFHKPSPKVTLTACYSMLNFLGGRTQLTQSWDIGKRGKVTERRSIQ